MEKVLRGVLLAGKPGNFDEVPGLDKLVEMMKEVKMVEPGK